MRFCSEDVTESWSYGRPSGQRSSSEVRLPCCRLEMGAHVAQSAGGERFHLSLLLFFKLHVRLFLNSFGLQSSFLLTATSNAARPAPSLSALSMCYTSGVETLKLVGEEFAKVDMLVSGRNTECRDRS